MSDRYYLNNMTEGVITLTLSTNRAIEPMSSLPLNTKDITMFKVLKAKRAGKSSALDGLRLSKIRIEDDTNYKAMHAMKEEKPVEVVAEEKPVEISKGRSKAKVKEANKGDKAAIEEEVKKQLEANLDNAEQFV